MRTSCGSDLLRHGLNASTTLWMHDEIQHLRKRLEAGINAEDDHFLPRDATLARYVPYSRVSVTSRRSTETAKPQYRQRRITQTTPRRGSSF